MLSGTVGGSSCAPSVSSDVGGGGVHGISGSSFRTHSPSGSMVGATRAHAQDTSSGSTVATSIRTTGVHGSPIISSGRFLQLNCNSVVSSSVGTTPVIPPGSSAIVAI